MAAAVCPHCGALTSTRTGYCDVCRQPLQGAQTMAATPPTPAGTYTTVGLPQPVYAPAYPVPPPAVYAPGFPVPVPAIPTVPAAQGLARRAVGRRWAAALIDFVLVFAGWFLLFPYFTAAGGGATGLLLTLAYGFAYYTIPDAVGPGTVGKAALGLRVVDINMRRAGVGRLAGRACELFAWALLFGLFFFVLQLYYTLKIGQGLGDYVTKTYVVRKRDAVPYALNR